MDGNKAAAEVEMFMDLPLGFRFHPTDEEIITHYLIEKVMNTNFTAFAVSEADLNKYEPWDLPKKAKMGEKEWYFFCQRDRKYPTGTGTGTRTNRATESGYWKATGKDKEIYKGKSSCLVGMKKTLVFYRGRAPKGEKTNWVMHEYRLHGKFSCYNLPKSSKEEWVVSRVFHKNSSSSTTTAEILMKNELPRVNSSIGDAHFFLHFSSMPPLIDPSSPKAAASSSFSHGGENNDHDFKSINNIHPTLFKYQSMYTQINQGSTPSPNINVQGTGSLGETDQLRATPNINGSRLNNYKQEFKVEQASANQSMVSNFSQETGLSSDMNNNTNYNEISSGQLGIKSYSYTRSSFDDMLNLDHIWDY